MIFRTMSELGDTIKGLVQISKGTVRVLDPIRVRERLIDPLIETAISHEKPDLRGTTRWIIKMLAQEMGVYPSSIQGLYEAMDQGKFGGLTIPTISVEGLDYDSVRAIIRAVRDNNVGAFVLQMHQSQTDEKGSYPFEHAAILLAAAIKEKFVGPIFFKWTYFTNKYSVLDAKLLEIVSILKEVTKEAVTAGFLNIAIESFPLVGECELTAELNACIRKLQPKEVMISVGRSAGEKSTTVETDLKENLPGKTEERFHAIFKNCNVVGTRERVQEAVDLIPISFQIKDEIDAAFRETAKTARPGTAENGLD